MMPFLRNLLAIFIIEAFLLFGFVAFTFTYARNRLGFPFAAYWGVITYLSIGSIVYLLRDALAKDYRPINFLNRKYYSSHSVLLALLLFLPLTVILFSIPLSHQGSSEEELLKKSDIAFIGQVAAIESPSENGLPFSKIRFSILEIIKGEEYNFSLPEAGIIRPEGCLFAINNGEIFKVYLKRDITSSYVLSCDSLKKLEPQ